MTAGDGKLTMPPVAPMAIVLNGFLDLIDDKKGFGLTKKYGGWQAQSAKDVWEALQDLVPKLPVFFVPSQSDARTVSAFYLRHKDQLSTAEVQRTMTQPKYRHIFFDVQKGKGSVEPNLKTQGGPWGFLQQWKSMFDIKDIPGNSGRDAFFEEVTIEGAGCETESNINCHTWGAKIALDALTL